jgi:hypothetical protein
MQSVAPWALALPAFLLPHRWHQQQQQQQQQQGQQAPEGTGDCASYRSSHHTLSHDSEEENEDEEEDEEEDDDLIGSEREEGTMERKVALKVSHAEKHTGGHGRRRWVEMLGSRLRDRTMSHGMAVIPASEESGDEEGVRDEQRWGTHRQHRREQRLRRVSSVGSTIFLS